MVKVNHWLAMEHFWCDFLQCLSLTHLLNRAKFPFYTFGCLLRPATGLQESWDLFFCGPNKKSAHTIMQLIFRAPQIVGCAHMHANMNLAVYPLQRYKYLWVEGKLKVYSTHHQQVSIPLTGLLSTQNQTTRQLSVNCVWKQWTWNVLPSVCWLKAARLLGNILIGTPRLCRNVCFAQITQMPSNTDIMAEIFANFLN